MVDYEVSRADSPKVNSSTSEVQGDWYRTSDCKYLSSIDIMTSLHDSTLIPLSLIPSLTSFLTLLIIFLCQLRDDPMELCKVSVSIHSR